MTISQNKRKVADIYIGTERIGHDRHNLWSIFDSDDGSNGKTEQEDKEKS